MRIGIIGTSEIAFRRFLPALKKCKEFTYVGVATRPVEPPERSKAFQDTYGGKIYPNFDELIKDESLNAVYVPLPSGLHYEWGKKVLEAGKHLLLEKPFTTNIEDTKKLIALANEKGLAVHENYMFAFHNQLSAIDEIVKKGTIGDVRLYRIAFGFPKRSEGDFRYNKALGGGALLDCCGYTLKLASMLLGGNAKVAYSHLNYVDGYDVDMYGSAAVINDEGTTAQLSFGMDNSYKCELEIWGSKGCFKTNRILTAPVDFEPTAEIIIDNETKTITLPSDDTFAKSIMKFYECIQNEDIRKQNEIDIIKQAMLVQCIKESEKN